MDFINLERYFIENNIYFEKNFPTSKMSSFEIGGNAKIVVFPKTINEFCNIIKIIRQFDGKFYIVGNCTNVFFSDLGFDGILISTKCLKSTTIDGNYLVASAGALITDCAILSMSNNLSGLEFLSGIPGTVGGAIYMNSSAYDSSVGDIVESCKVYDAENDEIIELNSKQLCFSKKTSIFSKNRNLVLLNAKFNLSCGKAQEIRQTMLQFSLKRINSQPLEFGSCGSAFKRPLKTYASKLIDDLELKGFKIGGAEISKKHAGFIVNSDNATSDDVLALISEIRKRVLREFNIFLEQEIIFVN